ncbi:MAG: metallophosphoesterase family protein [Roseburia sp.]
MKIALISDTHGEIPQKALDHIAECDYIVHAGDIGSRACYDKLKGRGKPVYMVKGNNDWGAWCQFVPKTLAFTISGKEFYLIHDAARLVYPYPEVDYVICGHTHRFDCVYQRGAMYINPGSTTEARGGSCTMAILHLDEEDSPRVEPIIL